MTAIESYSLKTLATATATLFVRCTSSDPAAIDAAARTFERDVDQFGILRREGPAEIVTKDDRVELRCRVAYGPVYGCHPADIKRPLGKIVERSSGLFEDGRVADFSRRILRSAEVVRRVTVDLTAKMNDPGTPETVRVSLWRTLARLEGITSNS